jgi:hypothetical protein
MGLTALYITICRKHDDHFVNPYIAAVLLPDQELSVCRSESGYLCVLHVDATVCSDHAPKAYSNTQDRLSTFPACPSNPPQEEVRKDVRLPLNTSRSSDLCQVVSVARLCVSPGHAQNEQYDDRAPSTASSDNVGSHVKYGARSPFDDLLAKIRVPSERVRTIRAASGPIYLQLTSTSLPNLAW